MARRIFPRTWWNADTTEAGREALGFYHEKKDEARNIGLEPEHDWSSHLWDAFGLKAIVYEAPPVKSAPFGDHLRKLTSCARPLPACA